MKLRSDADGFIQGGETIPSLTRNSGSKAESLLYSIDTNVAAMRKEMGHRSPVGWRGSDKEAVAPVSRVGTRRNESGLSRGGSRSPFGGALPEAVSPVVAVPTGKTKAGRTQAADVEKPAGAARRSMLVSGSPVKPGKRDEKGRFVSRGDGENNSTPGDHKGAGDEPGALKSLGDRIASAINGSGSMDEADPAVKAFNEVAQPLARGYSMLSGGDKAERQKTGWFRKILGELRMFRAEETGFSKAAGKSLKALEERPEAGAAAGGGGMLSTILNGIKGALPGVSTLLKGLAVAAAPLLAMLKVTQWAADTTHDEERVEGIKEDAVKPAKEALQAVGIDKDAEIAKAREATLEKRDGEYAKEQAAKATFAPSGIAPGTKEYDDAFYRAQQAKEAAAEAEKKKGFIQKGIDKVKSVGRAVFGNRNKDAMVRQMAESGITDPKEQAMFLAQLDHESGGFTKMEESFNYKSAARLMQVSGSARKKGQPAVEQAMAQGPEAVAELMYGGRMGNKSPGDAYAFRGRGAIQLTGRENYARAGKALGLDLENHPELAAEPENSAKVAAWYWKDTKLGAAARMGDVRAVTKKINGGTNGLTDRIEKYGKYLSAASAGAFSMATPVAVSARPAPTVRTPSVPTPAEAPPVTIPLSSGGKSQTTTVVQAPSDIGQDVRDRRIAHIVTGGVAN
jgi:predicted chitinase